LLTGEHALLLKHLHMSLAATSVSLFLLRFGLRERRPAALARPGLRIAPHLIDTLLLLSGLGLAIHWRLSPLEAQWFGAKLVLVLVYIVLGSLALKRCRSRAGRRLACAAALATVGAVAALAILKPF
jgi:uncharacterized membrane protein SirB2